MRIHPMMAKLDPNESVRRSFGFHDGAAEGVGLKDLRFIPADAGLWGNGSLVRALFEYGGEVGDGLDSNVVMAPVQWIMRTFTEAHAVVQSRTDGVWHFLEDHAVEMLVDQPNDFYDADALWKSTCISYALRGDAYWRKVRNRYGTVIQLWYVPHWMMEPRWPQDGSEFISHYDYTPQSGLTPIRLEPRDVVHFRFGLDPRNTRKGLSPLHAVLREVYTDDEAQNFSAKILQNMGVPGLMVSPKSDAFRPNDEQLKMLKEYMRTAFSGGNKGGTLVMGVPTDVSQFGFDPNKLMLGNLRDIAEERVCAALGLPTEVVGFGSGLQATTVGATMREKRRLAWVQCLTPMQKSMARQLTRQLLSDFVVQRRRFRARFDMSDVSVFQEEADLNMNRAAVGTQAGILRIDRAQEMAGVEVDEEMKYYLRPSNSIPIDEHGKPVEEAVPNGAVDQRGQEDFPAPVANRMNGANGNGRPDEEE